ncbi:MAG TPA: electron transfer flavoprotein subunit beta/FixA family protein [candidate division Zixibacteria bacterium]|nr:electron transfer flavoprotein subunit beta/FixA family protein [candidate division Zixibacteria bacterium]
MNIVVCGKVIPASTVTIEIDPATKRMVRKGVAHELDPAAACAVEEGLRLVEKHGGTVTLITMGIADATIGIRNALAMGATSAVHILDDAVAGSDTLGTAKVLAAAIKKQPFDLVLCATESSDSYSGIVPGQIAFLLGVPPLSFAKEIAVEGDRITIKRQSESGFDVVESTLPALVAVSSGINEPRYPQLKGIMAAKKKEIKVYTAADLGLSPDQVGEKGAKEKVLTIGRPPKRQAGKIVTDEGDGGRQIADFLAEIKVI